MIKWGRILFGPFELRGRKFGQQGMAGGQPTEDGLYSNLTLHFPHLKRLKNERRQVRAEAKDLKEWRQTKLKGLFLQNCEASRTMVAWKKYSCRRAAVVSIYSRIFLLFKTNAYINFRKVFCKQEFFFIMKKENCNSAENKILFYLFVLSRAFFAIAKIACYFFLNIVFFPGLFSDTGKTFSSDGPKHRSKFLCCYSETKKWIISWLFYEPYLIIFEQKLIFLLHVRI